MRHEIHTKYRLLLSINMSHADTVRRIYCMYPIVYVSVGADSISARKPCGSVNACGRAVLAPTSIYNIG